MTKMGLLGAACWRRLRTRPVGEWKKSKKLTTVLVLPLTMVLAACSLNGQMNISANGQAQITVSAVVERSLADSNAACQKILGSIFSDFLQLKDVEVTSDDDAANLKCQATTSLNLNQAGWDGHEGRPLWQTGPAQYEPAQDASGSEKASGPSSMEIAAGQHRLFLPLSQGSQGMGITQAMLADLSGRMKPTLKITMPEQVTYTSAGRSEGNTVTLNGVTDFVKDLDIVSGGNWWQSLSATTRTLIWGVSGVAVLSLLVIIVARHRRKRRQAR